MSNFQNLVREHVNSTVPPVDVDALIEDLYTAPIPTVRTITGRPPRRQISGWVAAAVAAAVVLIAVGGAAWLLGGNAPEVADEPVTTITVAPEVTTTAPEATPTTVAPPVTSVAPVPLAYDEVLDGSAAAFHTSMALARDGNPVIASYVRAPAFGDEPTTSGIRLVRCLDRRCVEPVAVVDLADVGWQGAHGAPQLALDPFDRPVVGYYGEKGPTIAFCSDPECSSIETRYVDEARIWVSDWAFTADGNPVYTHVIYAESVTHDLVTCLDRFCDATTSTRIDNGAGGLRLAADGSVLLAYSTRDPIGPPDPEAGYDGADHFGVQKVAWCEDVTCSGGPVITTIDSGVNVGGSYFIEGASGVEIWYVAEREHIRRPTGPDDEHLAVEAKTYGKALCLDARCTEFELTLLGPYEFAGASSSPLPAWLPEVAAPDASRMDVERRGTTLLLERWSDAGGGTWAFTTLVTFEADDLMVERLGGFYDWANDASLAIGENGLPVVVYGDDAGVHLIRCPDLACTPPNDG